MTRRRQAFGASLTGGDVNESTPAATEPSAPTSAGRQAQGNHSREGNRQQRKNGSKKGREVSSVAAVDQGGPASKIAHAADVEAAARAIENLPGPSADVAGVEDQQVANQLPPAISDEDTCFICAERIVYWSVGQCGHQTCHVCALRLRVFYK